MNRIKLLDIILGYSCNSGCIYCSIDDNLRKINMTTEEAKKFLNTLINKYKPQEVRFGGGEPTTRKDLIELINITRLMGIKIISIQTNGYMLFYSDYLEKLLNAGLNKVRISLRSLDRRKYQNITGIKNSFDLVNKAIENLKIKKIKTIVDFVLIKSNLLDLKNINNFLEKCNISQLNIWGLWYSGRAINNKSKLLYKYSDAATEIKNICDTSKLNIKLMYFPACIFGKKYLKYIWNPLNEACLVVTPSEKFYLDKEKFMNLNKSDKCLNCSMKSKCIGVSEEYIHIFGTDEINPIN